MEYILPLSYLSRNSELDEMYVDRLIDWIGEFGFLDEGSSPTLWPSCPPPLFSLHPTAASSLLLLLREVEPETPRHL